MTRGEQICRSSLRPNTYQACARQGRRSPPLAVVDANWWHEDTTGKYAFDFAFSSSRSSFLRAAHVVDAAPKNPLRLRLRRSEVRERQTLTA